MGITRRLALAPGVSGILMLVLWTVVLATAPSAGRVTEASGTRAGLAIGEPSAGSASPAGNRGSPSSWGCRASV